jgi:thioredoxin 1
MITTIYFRKNIFLLVLTTLLLTHVTAAQTLSTESSTGFPPLDQWKSAILAGDTAALSALYSADPPAQVSANGVSGKADVDLAFWTGLKARNINIAIVRWKDKPNGKSVIFKAEVRKPDGKLENVTEAQGWRNQDGQWHITGVERTDDPYLKQPSDMKKVIYPTDADAHAELREAKQKAAAEHKRVLLVFGANWCYDCHVLDLAFQRTDLAPVLEAGYVVVHIDLGDDEKKNADLVEQFEVPLNKGIPALAVIDSDGALLVSQKNGEFEDARSLMPEALLAFLDKWKPQG